VTEEIKWQENGREVSCNDFCGPAYEAGFYEGNEVKICGWNALQYPVELSENALKNDKKTYTIESFDKMFTCILPAETEKGISWGNVVMGTAAWGLAGTGCAVALMVGVAPGLVACPVLFTVSALINWAVSYNHLIIDTELVSSSKKGTCTYGIETATSLVEFKVKSSGFFEEQKKPSPTVYIASSKDEGTFGKKYTTVVLSTSTYPVIKSTVPVSFQAVLEEPDSWVKKYRVVTDKDEYHLWINIDSKEVVYKGREIDHYECEDPYWIVFSVKNLTSGETKSAKFMNVGDKAQLFNFVIEFNEWKEKKCRIGLDSTPPRNAYGSANFNITYYPNGVPEGLVPPSQPECREYGKDDCPPDRCKWCEKCRGHYVNKWRRGICVDNWEDCGYICGDQVRPYECGAGECGPDASWNSALCRCSFHRGPP